MTKKKNILRGLLVVAVGFQFIRPEPNVSTTPPGKDDLLVGRNAPPEVRRLIQTACYDCHSNNTRYPWYSSIQPAAW
jgi:hypothetical protein